MALSAPTPRPRDPGWILLAGLALVSVGWTARSQENPDAPQPPPPTTRSLPFGGGYGTADSNGRMIAVTGVDITGGTLLFLVDTESRHLSVYSATGGTQSTMGLEWVGARNIDLDLQVDGYNDESKYTYKDLASRFARGVDPPK